MTIRVNPQGPLAGVLTPAADVNATPQGVRSKYFDGELPPEDLIRPHGKMMAVLVFRDAGGKSVEGVLIPDSVVWNTPLMVVAAAGPMCQWAERGDVVAVFPPVAERMEKVRIGGWELLLIHEEQTQGTVPGLRVLKDVPRKSDQK